MKHAAGEDRRSRRRYWLLLATSVLAAVGVVLTLAIRRGDGEVSGDAVLSEWEEQGEEFHPAMLADRDRLEIAELLIGRMLPHHDTDYECFVALGRLPGAGQTGPWIAPGPALLERLQRYAFPVKSVSDMEYAGGAVKDIRTGKRGCVYYVEFLRRIGPDSFRVDGVSESGGLAASGRTYSVIKQNGRWTAEAIGGWNS